MRRILLTLPLLALTFSGCSKMVLNKVSDGLSGGGSNFMMKDNDPEFIQAALPVALKMYEGLIEQNPTHRGLRQAAAAGFTGYSYAFIQMPADTLTNNTAQQQHMTKRASAMYLRARDYGLSGLELTYPGFKKSLRDTANPLLSQTTIKDIDLLYWTGMAWMGAFTTDKFNMSLALSVPQAKKLLFRVAELNPDYGQGAIDEFFITFYGAMPASMGGDLEKAKKHFERATQLTEENSAGPYLAYAEAVAIPQQNVALFDSLLEKALEVKPQAVPENLLLRTIQKQKAQWLLNQKADLFLLPEDTTSTNNEDVAIEEEIQEDASSSDQFGDIDESNIEASEE